MKAGFYETDITPPVGAERAGAYSKLYIQSVLTPLKVRAGVFDNGQKKAVFAGVDVCMIDAAACDAACDIVNRICGIPRKNIMIGASHTHSGGAVCALSCFSGNKGDVPPDIYDLAANESTQPDPDFRRLVIRQLASAIIMADKNAEEALINFGSGSESRYVFNRRFYMKNGTTCTHPGARNPEIKCPAGPIDPEVGVLGAWRKDGTLLGCVVNYACHGTFISGSNASADWIHYMQNTVKKIMGKGSVAVFLNGACGDITQVNNLSYERYSGYEAARKMGTRVGAEAVKVLYDTEPREYSTIETQWKILKIARRRLSKENLRRSQETIKPDTDHSDAEWTFAKEKIIYDYAYSQSPEAEIRCQAIQVGNALFLSNPSEYFCQFGLDIKKASHMLYTFVVSLANDCVGYVPTPESFEASGGGYETILSSYSNLEPTAGVKIADACIEFSRHAKEEILPDPYADCEPVTEAWPYGTFRPEVE